MMPTIHVEPLPSEHLPAFCGCGPVMEEGKIVKRTKRSWINYAERCAKKKSNKVVVWNAVLAYIPWRDAYRISYGSQDELHKRR